MAVKSLFDGGASGILFQDRRQFYISPQRVAEFYGDVYPFTTLVQTLRTENVNDTLYKMFQHRAGWVKQEMQINNATPGTVPNDNTGLAVAIDGITNLGGIGSHLKNLQVEVWDSTKATKKGVAVITSVDTANSKVTLKSLKNATISLADNDYLIVIGATRGEKATAGDAFSDELSVVWNSTQYISVPVEISKKLARASLRGYNSELARLRDDKGKMFKMLKENIFLKGASTVGTNLDGSESTGFTEANLRTDENGEPLRTTYGFISATEDYGNTSGDLQNIFTINSGTFTYADYVDMAEKLFLNFEGDQRFAFSSRKAMSFWSKLDSTNYMAGKSGWGIRISDMKTNKLGFNIRIIDSPHGELHLVSTKALRDAYDSYMALPDHNYLFLAQFEPDTFKNNVKTDDDYGGIKDVYVADQGLGLELIEKHAIIKFNPVLQ